MCICILTFESDENRFTLSFSLFDHVIQIYAYSCFVLHMHGMKFNKWSYTHTNTAISISICFHDVCLLACSSLRWLDSLIHSFMFLFMLAILSSFFRFCFQMSRSWIANVLDYWLCGHEFNSKPLNFFSPCYYHYQFNFFLLFPYNTAARIFFITKCLSHLSCKSKNRYIDAKQERIHVDIDNVETQTIHHQSPSVAKITTNEGKYKRKFWQLLSSQCLALISCTKPFCWVSVWLQIIRIALFVQSWVP